MKKILFIWQIFSKIFTHPNIHKTQAGQVMLEPVMITVILFHYQPSPSHDSQFITRY